MVVISACLYLRWVKLVRVCWLHQMKIRSSNTAWSRLLFVKGVQATEEVLIESRRPGLRRWWWGSCCKGRRN